MEDGRTLRPLFMLVHLDGSSREDEHCLVFFSEVVCDSVIRPHPQQTDKKKELKSLAEQVKQLEPSRNTKGVFKIKVFFLLAKLEIQINRIIDPALQTCSKTYSDAIATAELYYNDQTKKDSTNEQPSPFFRGEDVQRRLKPATFGYCVYRIIL